MFTVHNRKIFLEKFILDCEIGIHPFEIGKTQKVTVDVALEIDPSISQTNGDINTVIDYDFIREGIFGLVKGRVYKLQEQLCDDIARLCLSKDGVLSVTVRTCKPDVYPDCDAVCYEVSASNG